MTGRIRETSKPDAGSTVAVLRDPSLVPLRCRGARARHCEWLSFQTDLYRIFSDDLLCPRGQVGQARRLISNGVTGVIPRAWM